MKHSSSSKILSWVSRLSSDMVKHHTHQKTKNSITRIIECLMIWYTERILRPFQVGIDMERANGNSDSCELRESPSFSVRSPFSCLPCSSTSPWGSPAGHAPSGPFRIDSDAGDVTELGGLGVDGASQSPFLLHLYMNVRSQKSQGIATNTIPATGYQAVFFDSGKAMYIAKKTPPETMNSRKRREMIHMRMSLVLRSTVGIGIWKWWDQTPRRECGRSILLSFSVISFFFGVVFVGGCVLSLLAW